MNTAILPEDIAKAIDHAGFCVKRVFPLTMTPDPERPRSTYRIELESGTTLKARRLESEEAARTQHELRALMPSAFTRVLSRSGTILLEEWVDGTPLTEPEPPDDIVRTAGHVMADLHAVSQAEGRILPYDENTSRLREFLLSRLNAMQMAGIIPETTIQSLRAIILENDPGHARCGLTHHDFCGENMVVDNAGILHIVDNERTCLDAFALDIARTWYRWGLGDQRWNWFHEAYVAAKGGSDVFDHDPFWRIAGVTLSAWIRFRAAHPGLQTPLRKLELLSKSSS